MLDLIRQIASQVGVYPNLAVAIAQVESGLVASRVRYESHWPHFVAPALFAKKLGISVETETQLQKFSWGMMQVMGAVARELLYDGHLTELIRPETGILYGCRKLKNLSARWPMRDDLIAAYNAGSPIKENGVYKNNNYVKNVIRQIELLQNPRG